MSGLLPSVADRDEALAQGCSAVGEGSLGGNVGCLTFTGFDPDGRPILREVSGFHARVVQHECDHLDGILYPMRMRDLRMFGYTDVLFPDAEVIEE